ncbi:MAG: type II toxin-antitoxin system VapC family toxin [Hydrococcus sp. SU_1_0]|nr:type II toxin-antitoxin system VapC family toxin [Hydrococcus sp. SU_1_0]
MQVLLDTHTFLWWVTNDSKLSSPAHTIISDPQNEIFFSIVSAWEIVIKAKLGKLPLPQSPDIYIPSRIKHYGFKKTGITLNDVLQVWQLGNHHNDPFDRLLIAQSQVRNLPILSGDSKFSHYNVNVIW